MEREKKLTCEQAKEIDLVTYLSGLGHEPVRIRNANYWYLSPLRAETTPSFKVNSRLNRWYDFGIGKGGNLIDFGINYYKCTVAELLQLLSGDLSFPKHTHQSFISEAPEIRITIERVEPINAPSLLQYLQTRRIDIEIARHYCREVHYRVGDKTYYAIGFKNSSGGYELRSPFFKGSTSPKDITTIENGRHTVQIFEGFFDFLSYQTYCKSVHLPDVNFVILNSLSFFEKARPFMEKHGRKLLSLDHDQAGQSCSDQAVQSGNGYEDHSYLYKGYKDMNKWLIEEGHKQ